MSNKIHGETRIVLRNPISGNIIKDVTSENTFQSGVIAQGIRNLGVQNIIHSSRPDGVLGGETYSIQDGLSWHNTVGGILLFRDNIQNGTMYMPAGNRMVGNGSYRVTNSETPNELGSYNLTESSEGMGAVTQVYDFATNQANGNISCVCLTSQVGGFIGYGNPSETKIASGKSRNLLNNQTWNYNTISSGRATRNNKTYTFDFVGGTHILTVTIKKCPFTRAGISSNMTEVKTFDLNEVYTGHSSAYWNLDRFSQDGRYVYISFTEDSMWQRATGSTLYIFKYDLDTDTVTLETFTNTAPFTVRNAWITIANGLAFVVEQNETKTAVINLSTNILVKTLDYPTIASNFGDNLIMCRTSSTDLCTGIYDVINDTIYPTNMFFEADYGTPRLYYYDETTNSIYNQGIRLFCNPLYLATINNLNSPVTKTAAQTMKVTYTLTEA